MGPFQHQYAPIDLGAESQAVRDRVAAVPERRPCDRAVVESALAEHLAALDRAPRPVRWIDAADPVQAAREGFLASWGARDRASRAESGQTGAGHEPPDAARLARATAAATAALAEKDFAGRVGMIPMQSQGERDEGRNPLEEEVRGASAAAQALEAARWLGRAHVLKGAGLPSEAHDRLVRGYLPLVDAVEAGLWLFWVLEDEVIAIAAPDR